MTTTRSRSSRSSSTPLRTRLNPVPVIRDKNGKEPVLRRWCGGEHRPDCSGARGRRRGISPADRALPARASGALLPNPRLAAGRRGRLAGNPARGVARTPRLPGTRLAPHLALPGRDQPLPERAAIGEPAPACGHGCLEADLPEPTLLGEVVWIEPYPDVLLEGLIDLPPGPEARY